jgi:hypothetical protein
MTMIAQLFQSIAGSRLVETCRSGLPNGQVPTESASDREEAWLGWDAWVSLRRS